MVVPYIGSNMYPSCINAASNTLFNVTAQPNIFIVYHKNKTLTLLSIYLFNFPYIQTFIVLTSLDQPKSLPIHATKHKGEGIKNN